MRKKKKDAVEQQSRPNKRTIHLFQVITAAMLKFDILNHYQFDQFCRQIEKDLNVKIDETWDSNRLTHYIYNYIDFDNQHNDVIELHKGYTLDFEIDRYHSTIENLFTSLAGDELVEYINNMDKDEFMKSCEEKFTKNKSDVLENANVLLISEVKEDFEAMKKYGFKNVDYFRSVIRADKYWQEHPDFLKQYNLVVLGNRTINGDITSTYLENKINNLQSSRELLEATVLDHHIYDYPKYSLFLINNNSIHTRYVSGETTYDGVFDRIIENTVMNDMMKTTGVREWVPYQDTINPEKLPFPKTKKDLKVLCLNDAYNEELSKLLIDELGVDLTLEDDNNFALDRNCRTKLGDYDIIIASSSFSHKLVRLAAESSEQCKDTGRQLTLLAVYKENEDRHHDMDGNAHSFGDKIILQYVFGGELSTDDTIHKFEYYNSIPGYDEISKITDNNYIGRKHYDIKSIISVIANIYNETLKKNTNDSITDMDLKKYSDYDEEYKAALQEFNDSLAKEYAPIKKIDQINTEILNYLYYVENNQTDKIPHNIRLEEDDDTTTIIISAQNRDIASIRIKKYYNHKNLRTFELRSLNNKNQLSAPIELGYYTAKYNGAPKIPQKPNESQEKIIDYIAKRVTAELSPINQEASKAPAPPIQITKKKRRKHKRKKK